MAEIELNRNFKLPIEPVSEPKIEDFLDAVKSMEKATSELVISSDCIGLATVINKEQDASDIAINFNSDESFCNCARHIWNEAQKRVANGYIMLYSCAPGGKFQLKALRTDALRQINGMSETLIDELKHSSKTIMTVDNHLYIVSDLAFSTLNNRARLGGDAMSHPSVGRVVECAKSFYLHKPQDIKLIVRTNKDAKVVVAAHSGKYCYVPQTVLCDIYEKIASDLGRTQCLNWEVNHEISYCYIGFPDIAREFSEIYKLPDNIIPGLHISTSDSGDGSLIIRGIWNINDRTIGGEVVKRNHRGEIDVDAFVEKAWETIFAQYNSIPMRLTELLTIDVPNPAWTLKSVFKQIELAKAANFGCRNSAALYKELCREFHPGVSYTAYDVAMAFASAPERCVGLHHSVIEKMQALVHKAIFADYTRKPKKDEKEDPIFVLT